MNLIRLLIFDLDGTLVDSAPDIITTVNNLMLERGHEPLPDKQIIAAIGEGLKQLVFSLFPETHGNPKLLDELDKEFFKHYEENLLIKTTVFPGVEEFLEKLPKVTKIAVVTNKNERLALAVLAGLKLDRFPWVKVFGADSLPRKKPDPLPLNEVMRIAGVPREQTVMVGDGIPDMIAGRRAGVHTVAIGFGYTQLPILQGLGSTMTLSSFAELPSILKEISKLNPREIAPE